MLAAAVTRVSSFVSVTFHLYDLDALSVLARIELAWRLAQLRREKANATTLYRLCLSFLPLYWSVVVAAGLA